METLYKREEELREICSKLRMQIKVNDDPLIKTEFDKYKEEYYDVLKRIEELENKKLMEGDPYISNNEIALYLISENNEVKNCKILLSEEFVWIGKILFRGNNISDITLGNISYEIDSKYRGNNYALKALNLLTDKLYEEGIDKVYISAQKYNVPSIRTIEKFGGKIMNRFEDVISYECDLTEIKNIKKKSM